MNDEPILIGPGGLGSGTTIIEDEHHPVIKIETRDDISRRTSAQARRSTSILPLLLGIASLGGGIDALAGMGWPHIPERRQARKCHLPGCEEWTTHNGGFCCAEHCIAYRRLNKSLKT